MKKNKTKKKTTKKKTVLQVTLGALGRPEFIVFPSKSQRLNKLMRRFHRPVKNNRNTIEGCAR